MCIRILNFTNLSAVAFAALSGGTADFDDASNKAGCSIHFDFLNWYSNSLKWHPHQGIPLNYPLDYGLVELPG